MNKEEAEKILVKNCMNWYDKTLPRKNDDANDDVGHYYDECGYNDDYDGDENKITYLEKEGHLSTNQSTIRYEL